ncbi:hypothetical protein [Shivajiella indica]|uniref:TonB C-terminal domain-containing protein n=1 Tax=Shivajiella indica TaxID=872115 RepID=A0ABW5BFP1_9BACT
MRKFYIFVLIAAMGAGAFIPGNGLANNNEEKSIAKEEKTIELKIVSIQPSSQFEQPFYFEMEKEIEYTHIAPWAFPVHTLDIVDSYVPFIFRTKKSAEIEELKVIISINDKGKLTGYEVLNEEADKGLKERIGYVVRQMPNALAVPGFQKYEPMDFELVIRK